MITFDNWRQRMSEDMRLRDLRPRTQEGYLLCVRQFLAWAKREPETLTEEDVRRYFLYLRDDRRLSPSSVHIAVCALRCFLSRTLRRDWAVLGLLRVQQPRRLPVVLSRREVRALLGTIRHPVRRMALGTIYALGLRLGECLALTAGDVDGDRLLVWVRDGKGGKDRGVPLPRPLLTRLRRYWKEERPTSTSPHLFIAPADKVPDSRRGKPLHETTLQKTWTAARTELGLGKHATVHSLRHSYATHLLEAGVSLRTIQQVLGHKSLRTTSVYMHVTQPGVEHLQSTLDRLMADIL